MTFITDPQSAAFPRAGNFDFSPQSGMSIREHFAALAMQGLLASCTGDSYPNSKVIAQIAVEAADALIAELNKTPSPIAPSPT